MRAPSTVSSPPLTVAAPPADQGKPCHSPVGGSTANSADAAARSVTSPSPSVTTDVPAPGLPEAKSAVTWSRKQTDAGVVKLDGSLPTIGWVAELFAASFDV